MSHPLAFTLGQEENAKALKDAHDEVTFFVNTITS